MKKSSFIIILFLFCSFIYSQSSSDYFFKGLDLEAKGLYPEAIQMYTMGLSLAPNSYELYNSRGIAYKKNREYENAIRDYTKAIKINVGFVFAYNNRGICYYLIKDYHKASKDFERAILLNPHFGYYYFLFMVASYKISNQAYKDALYTLKSNKELITDKWLYQIAKYLSGEITIRKLLNNADSSIEKLCEAYFYIGFKSRTEKRFCRAKRYFKKCIKTDQKNFIEYELALKELKKK
ncbi:MAG: tetratricopeptide repeat protein [Spirochaetes bacterium]|nr:tetratricopeptide repeat protein [Spirochaetota bacterium]